uniref:Ig-like domain-containing protein n=1 Tax=Podarcis muralis TaxID=64176 RepID=A0A670JUQ9_PODMU
EFVYPPSQKKIYFSGKWAAFTIFFSLLLESRGQIVITQTPASLQASPGDRVTILCRASSSVNSNMDFYQFKPGQKPKVLIYSGSSPFQETPDRFSGSRSNTDFSFTINGVDAEDEAEYHCFQRQKFPLQSETIQEDSTPSALIFPPTPEQLKMDSATAVCLVSTFYPSNLTVVWKVDEINALS